MRDSPTIFVYVQHLLGIGHLRRASFLARELSLDGLDVHLVSGGMPVPRLTLDSVTLHQLPPLRSLDGHFDNLVDDSGNPIDDAWRADRRDRLLALFHDLQPSVLITETFPFGRRMMRFETLPLLEAARDMQPSPLRVVSIRDILQPKSKPERNKEVLGWLEEFYDLVLVHGDERLATLADTFPLASRVAKKIRYTGYIAAPGSATSSLDAAPTNDGEVVVWGGGGAASLPLLNAVIEAHSESSLRDRHWRVLVGHNVPEEQYDSLRKRAAPGMTIERNRTDFLDLLRVCGVSVSQAGYNTV
ncbi:MAG: glycosyl transferase, partial [Pseudomonadota bacterium]